MAIRVEIRQACADERARGLVQAIVSRDFTAFQDCLHADVRLRALLPTGLVELVGAEAVAAKFRSWTAGAEQLELMRSDSDRLADRVRLSYRLRVRPHPFGRGPGWYLVEQQLICADGEDGLEAIDLVCSGFRPENLTAAATGS